MTVQEAISARHSVRTYLTKPVEPAIVNALRAEIRACNAEGGLHIQLVMNEPMAFRGFFAHYGKFRGVCNYIVLAGKRAKDLDERAGWFGERLVLLAPTAMNQQRFRFTLLPDDTVRAESRGGSYSHVDLGIVKYHFQLGAGRESFRWAE